MMKVSHLFASLKFCYVNARSLINKLQVLEEIVYMEEHDVIGVTESCINTSSRDFLAEFALPGHTLFKCKRQYREGGGVLLHVV